VSGDKLSFRDLGPVPASPAATVIERCRAIPTAVLTDVAGGGKALHGRIAPLVPSMRVVGPAFTVEVVPGDNLMLHAAIALAQPGDVVIADGKADLGCALIGSIMGNTAVARGIAGIVVDGALRDADELRELGLPVFAIGACPNGPTKRLPGRINVQVTVGDKVVNPGDLVIGDADGVVVLALDGIERVLELAEQKVAAENVRIAELRRGEKLLPDWLEASLRGAGLIDG
jgi:4-hydroxy-4-methyl-2-oxoglutarate aldolase